MQCAKVGLKEFDYNFDVLVPPQNKNLLDIGEVADPSLRLLSPLSKGDTCLTIRLCSKSLEFKRADEEPVLELGGLGMFDSVARLYEEEVHEKEGDSGGPAVLPIEGGVTYDFGNAPEKMKPGGGALAVDIEGVQAPGEALVRVGVIRNDPGLLGEGGGLLTPETSVKKNWIDVGVPALTQRILLACVGFASALFVVGVSFFYAWWNGSVFLGLFDGGLIVGGLSMCLLSLEISICCAWLLRRLGGGDLRRGCLRIARSIAGRGDG